MLDKLKGANIVVGTRRLAKALEENRVSFVYLADDCDMFISDKIRRLCDEKRVRIDKARTMKELGEACSIDVPAACAGILK